MFNVQTYDNIPAERLQWVSREKFSIGPEVSRPDAILLRSHDLHDAPIPATLLAVGRAGSGVNNIPIEALSKRGIPVFNAPGANANAVKELTIAALFLASRNIVAAAGFVRSLQGDDATVQKLVEKEKGQFGGFELAGRKLGVVGLGAIGVQVANTAIQLGMRVYGFDPLLTVEHALHLSPSVTSVGSLDDLLTEVDFLTLHIPLDNDTRRLIDGRRLSRLNDGAVLINFSRAGVVEEAAVCAALQSGKLHAYVTDFATRTILDQPRAIVLPHLGASTAEAESNCVNSVVESVVDFLENGEIRNSVNFPKVTLPRSGGTRLAIANENAPGVVSRISSALAAAELNIENLSNKSRDDYAFTLVDLNADIGPETLQLIRSTKGVLSARLIPKSAGFFE
ncbi:3-phosphoglycerate dehydrogenase family protein [Methylocystis bryophila]|uniref:D-3-phosphoglycerate dehydrogenase n=1 Tax=Methylocystis bryophila TaxID=655015 RepID=A0A1W6MZ52_9HYPH|nr:3-phosphoglycerate dehydrogenase family protein [Methylocystis bryophila]ARN82816.1 3-phosphoglycerate dehydrogenase [Methylocystis bryophila]BDV39068.1 D-3-phosphoglycerate dehydrogenase [Methylocystis bryophila]